jgi:hypothetical protein
VAVVGRTGGTPTGSVQFEDAGQLLGSPVALSNSGTANLTLSTLDVGVHTITAIYSGQGSTFQISDTTTTLVLNPSSQTITFGPLAKETFGAAPIALQASTTSGLGIAYSLISGPATLNGSTITITGAGTIIIEAGQAGNANYLAATSVRATLSVAQVTPSITWANPASIAFGTALSSAQLNATASVPGNFAYSSFTGTVLGAGNQTLSVTFTPTDSTDYATVSKSVTINVGPPPLVVIGEQAIFQRKTKKGKPVGKPILVGYELEFGAALNAAVATNQANYQFDTMTTKKVKKKVMHILSPIKGFTVTYLAANDAVELAFSGTQTFPTGGQITVRQGVSGDLGGQLSGTTVFNIPPKGSSITPA